MIRISALLIRSNIQVAHQLPDVCMFAIYYSHGMNHHVRMHFICYSHTIRAYTFSHSRSVRDESN